MDWLKFRSLVSQAIGYGAEVSPRHVRWDTAYKCSQAILRPFWSRPPKPTYVPSWWAKHGLTEMPEIGVKYGRYVHASKQSIGTRSLDDGYMMLDLWVPCRKCAGCLDVRRWRWRRRAEIEFKAWPWTWFCTFTVSPEHRLRAAIAARRDYGSDSYENVVKVINKWYTRYMKRVRKESGAKIRFVLAAEPHANGFPHLHALVHEVSGHATKRCLQGQWPYGFTNVRKGDISKTAYVTKYIAKQMTGRVHASLHYGRPYAIVDAAAVPAGRRGQQAAAARVTLTLLRFRLERIIRRIKKCHQGILLPKAENR